jgi:hypothetical protein
MKFERQKLNFISVISLECIDDVIRLEHLKINSLLLL